MGNDNVQIVLTSIVKWRASYNLDKSYSVAREEYLALARHEIQRLSAIHAPDPKEASNAASDSTEAGTLENRVEETEPVHFDPHARSKEPHKEQTRLGKSFRELEKGWVGIGNVHECHPLSRPQGKRCYFEANETVCDKIG